MKLILKNGKLVLKNGKLAADLDLCDCECGGEPPGVDTECCPDRQIPTTLTLSVSSANCACVNNFWELTYYGLWLGNPRWESADDDYKHLGSGDCNAGCYKYKWYLDCLPDGMGGYYWYLSFATDSGVGCLLDNAFSSNEQNCDPFYIAGTMDWSVPPSGCNIGDVVAIEVTE